MIKKIKIIFVLNNYNIGGPQKSLLALLDKVDYSKFEISLIALDSRGPLKDYFNSNCKQIVPNTVVTACTLPKKTIFKTILELLYIRKYSLLFHMILSVKNFIVTKDWNISRQKLWFGYRRNFPKINENFDIAVGVSSGLSTYFIVDCINANRKFHWIRGDYSRTKIDYQIDNYYFKSLNGSLSVSESCAAIFIEMFPFMINKVFTFNNLIPIDFYKKVPSDPIEINNEESTVLLTVARLDPFKGLDIAIDSCKYLLSNGYKVRWYVLGDGPHRKKVAKMIKNAGIENNFFLLGFKLNPLSYIEKCDIFIHPSKSEGKSNAVAEALFLRKPVIVTSYRTVEDQIINGMNGLICEMDSSSLAEKIIETIDNPSSLKLGFESDSTDSVEYVNNFLERLLN